MKFVCEFVGGPMAGQMPLEEAEALTEERNGDLSVLRAMGRLVRRVELDNRPVFDGYVGPMWDGTRPGGIAVLRYETQEVYNMLSN